MFSVHFAVIFGYTRSICSDVIPPLMDLQPCDAVFWCCFLRLETAVLWCCVQRLETAVLWCCLLRLETAVLGIGGHQRPKALALTHFFSHGRARTTCSFSQSHQESLRTCRKSRNSRAVDVRRNTVLKTAVVTGRYCLTKRTGLSAESFKHRRICPGTGSKRKSPCVQWRPCSLTAR